MKAPSLAYVALASNDVNAACSVFEQLGLPRQNLKSNAGEVPVFSIGHSSIAVFPLGHPLLEGEEKTGVHHIALALHQGTEDIEHYKAIGLSSGPAESGLGGRAMYRLDRTATAGVRTVLTAPLELQPHEAGPIQRIDHIGCASTDVAEDERIFAGKLGMTVDSRQTDMEVLIPVESFTSDKYGVVYHTRPPEPVGGLRVTFITVGDCDLEFLANFDPSQGGQVQHGASGSTRQDQGAIARFISARGRGLAHIALKATDINGTLARLAKSGVPLIDPQGRPGSRRAQIGFAHPKALGGILMHLVQRDA